MTNDKNYTQTWVRILRDGKGLEESDDRRRQLNAAIATIATQDIGKVFKSHLSVLRKEVAGQIMDASKREDKEPLECIVAVCNKHKDKGACPEVVLIAVKYTRGED